MRQILSVSIFLVILLSLAACSSQGGVDRRMYEGDIEFLCDESFFNVLDQHVFVFTRSNPGAYISVAPVSEADAVKALLDDSVRLIAISRELTAAEKEAIVQNRLESRSTHVAVDAVAFVVNKQNPDSVFTVDDIRRVMTGEATQWDQLFSGASPDRIQVIFDNRHSGTVRYVIDSICAPAKLAPGVSAVENSLEVIREVSRRPNAIGVIGAAWIEERDSAGIDVRELVAPVRIKKTADAQPFGPFQAYIASGDYPFFRSIYMIKSETYNGLCTGFTIFVAGQRGQKIFEKTNISPARIEERVINVSDGF